MIWVLVVMALVAVWLVALIDVIGATEMDGPGRVILALLLILMAPVGVIVWAVLRGGRVGQFAAAALIAVGIVFAVSLAAVNHAAVRSVDVVTQTYR
jgi:hypothetical protein